MNEPQPRALNRALSAFRRWLDAAPPGTLVPVDYVTHALDDPDDDPTSETQRDTNLGPPSWRERLWTVPPDTRIGATELAEALGVSRKWVYARTSTRGDRRPIPHRKIDGLLFFRVGDVRAWLDDTEERIAIGGRG